MPLPRVRLVTAAAALVAAAAACGSSGSSPTAGGSQPSGAIPTTAAGVYQALNKLPADQQESTALKWAKKEGGTLSLYTSYDPTALKAVTQGFEQKFGLQVKAYRAHSEDVLARVQQEVKANRAGADAVETNFHEMSALADAGAFAQYKGANLDRVPKDDRFGSWVADRLNIYLPAWNTDIIKPGQEPHSWADLADPRFDGKIAVEPGDYDWYAAVTLYWQSQGKSKAEIANLWKQIVDGAKISKGHTGTTELLAAGQVGLFADDYSHIAQVYVDKGAPVAYRGADGKATVPGFPRPQGVAIVKGAPHPAVGWLFTHWLISASGQKVLVNASVTSVEDISGDKTKQGITLTKYPAQSVHDNSRKWAAQYDALLRGVPKK